MITRTYLVLMPDETPTTPLDILVVSDPGTPDAAVTAGGDGAYFEWRGRPLRVPVFAVDGADEGFVPRLRLGFGVSIVPWSTGAADAIPAVQLSESLLGVITQLGSGVPNLADPGDEPVIRLIGTANTAGEHYIVTLMCPEAKDEDRSNTGSV